MIVSRRPGLALLLLCAGVFCFEGRAWAYTDPGSGALLWQTLAAAVVGVLFTCRRILVWFSHRNNNKPEKEPEQ